MEIGVVIALYVTGAYALGGIVLLVPFHRYALPQLDESAAGASVGFRVLVSPGLVALWPVVLRKWLVARRGGKAQGSPDAPMSSLNLRRTQSVLMKLLAIAVPLLVALAIAGRPAPAPPVDASDVRSATATAGD